MKNIVLLLFFIAHSLSVFSQGMIPVHPDSIAWKTAPLVIDEDNPERLIDEQESWGGVIQTPTVGWQPSPVTGWHYYSRPYMERPTVKIKLPAYYWVDTVAFYDRNGIGRFSVFTGEIDTSLYITDDQNRFNQWAYLTPTTPREVKSVTVVIDTVTSANGSPAAPVEIVLFGRYSRPKEPVINYNRPIHYPTLDSLMGLNGFNDEPLGRLACVSNIRFYHDWPWDQPDTSTFTYAPSGFAGQDFYQYYQTLSKSPFRFKVNFKQALRELVQSPEVMATADSLQEYAYAPDYKPIRWDRRHLSYDTTSYPEWQRFVTKATATFGSARVDTLSELMAPGQPSRVYGLGAIRDFEFRNEPDKTWRGEDGETSPIENAVITYVESKAVVDPEAKFIQGAISDPNLPYLKGMHEWYLERNLKWPIDVINVHYYPNDAGGQGGNATSGEAPEWDYGLINHHREVVDWANSTFPDVTVINTESGYDKNPGSPQAVQDVPGQDRYRTHAQWSVRLVLEISTTGIQEYDIYMLKDVNDTTSAFASALYTSSGLTSTKSNNFAPHPSWYWIYTLRYRLGDYRYKQDLESGIDSVIVREYENIAGDSTAFVIWSATKSGRKIPNFTWNLRPGDTNPKLIRFADTLTGGTVQYYRNESSVTIDTVSESPVMLFVANGNTPSVNYTPHNPLTAEIYPVDPSWVKFQIFDFADTEPDSLLINYEIANKSVLFDEQLTSGDPYMGEGTTPSSANLSYTSAPLPLFAKIEFPDSVDVGWVYFHDTNAKGMMLVKDDELKIKGHNKFQRFNQWTFNAINKKVKSLNLQIDAHPQTGEKLNLNELLVYKWGPPSSYVIDTTGLYDPVTPPSNQAAANGQWITREDTNPKAYVYLPDGYDDPANTGKKWPVLYNFQGDGQDATDSPGGIINLIQILTPAKQLLDEINSPTGYPDLEFIVISPLDNSGTWSADDIKNAYQNSLSWGYSIDTTATFHTGLSGGSDGLFVMAGRGQAGDSVVFNRIKGAMLLSGRGTSVAQKFVDYSIPIYHQVGENDPLTVPGTSITYAQGNTNFYNDLLNDYTGETTTSESDFVNNLACTRNRVFIGSEKVSDYCILTGQEHTGWEQFYSWPNVSSDGETRFYWHYQIRKWLNLE